MLQNIFISYVIIFVIISLLSLIRSKYFDFYSWFSNKYIWKTKSIMVLYRIKKKLIRFHIFYSITRNSDLKILHSLYRFDWYTCFINIIRYSLLSIMLYLIVYQSILFILISKISNWNYNLVFEQAKYLYDCFFKLHSYFLLIGSVLLSLIGFIYLIHISSFKHKLVKIMNEAYSENIKKCANFHLNIRDLLSYVIYYASKNLDKMNITKENMQSEDTRIDLILNSYYYHQIPHYYREMIFEKTSSFVNKYENIESLLVLLNDLNGIDEINNIMEKIHDSNLKLTFEKFSNIGIDTEFLNGLDKLYFFAPSALIDWLHNSNDLNKSLLSDDCNLPKEEIDKYNLEMIRKDKHRKRQSMMWFYRDAIENLVDMADYDKKISKVLKHHGIDNILAHVTKNS